MNLVHERSQIYPSRSKGLEGQDREVTFASCCMAKWVFKYVTDLKTQRPDKQERFRLADEHLGLKPGTARTLYLLNDTYVNPVNPAWAQFKLGYLCGVGLPRLIAFAPHLRKYYADPEGTWLGIICVTLWSIEVKISLGSESPAWKDINELTVDQIGNLENIVKAQQAKARSMCRWRLRSEAFLWRSRSEAPLVDFREFEAWGLAVTREVSKECFGIWKHGHIFAGGCWLTG